MTARLFRSRARADGRGRTIVAAMSPRPVPPPRSARPAFASSRAVLVLAAVFLLAAGRAGAAEERPPTFTVTPDTIRADSTGVWRAGLRIENHGEWGLYPDSLALEWRNLDDEPNTAPRQGRMSLTPLLHALGPAGAGESTGLDWNSPADFGRGTLTFHLHLHDAKKRAHALERTVIVAGNDLFDRHPAVLLTDAGGRKVEVVDIPAGGPGPVAGLVYVPPAGVSARMVLRWARGLARLGNAVTIVNQPGTGLSAGAPDRAGPASVAAVEAALAHLARAPGVDGKRLAIWGLGDGGTTALLAAARHPELVAVVAQNAEYDPWSAYRALPATDQAAFLHAAGRDSAGWRARSAGLVANRITSPVLVLHGAGMGAHSIAAAEAFVHARAARDLPTESRIEGGSAPPAGVRRDAGRLAMDFLTRRFGTR